jgi:hypothetical protein
MAPPSIPIKSPKVKGVPLTPREWAEAESLWETGQVTINDLVKKFGRSPAAFAKHFQRTGTKRGAKEKALKKRVAAAVEEAAVTESTVLAARIKETKEETYKITQGLTKLAWNELVEAKNAGTPIGTRLNNLKSIKTAMETIALGKDVRFSVLGIDKGDSTDPTQIPDLLIKELTAVEIEELQNRSLSVYGETVPIKDLADLELDDDDGVVVEGDDDDA